MNKKVLELMQVGQILGQSFVEQAKEFRANFKTDDYKKLFFQKAIGLTEMTKAKLEDLAHKNGVTLHEMKPKKHGKKAKAEQTSHVESEETH